MSGKIGSGWRTPSFSASSASVSSAPPMASMTPPSPDASAEASAKSILRPSHTNLPNRSSNSNPVSKVAIKLNKIVTQGLFACTSPDMLLEEELLMVHHQSVVLPTGRMRQKGGITSLFTDDDDDNGGIEIDRENSLRPAYDLYRV
jgi:hypothetical protein